MSDIEDIYEQESESIKVEGSMTKGEILEGEARSSFEENDEEVPENKKMNNYVIIKCLGKGAQGSVYLTLSTKDDTEKAMKRILCAHLNEANSVLEEALKLKALNHPGLVEYQEVFLDMNMDGDIYVCVIMDYYKHSDMQKYFQKNGLETLDEKTIINFMMEISSGLAFLHELKTIHRDIKPENIFVTDDLHYKIGDFGLAKFGAKTSLYSVCGSLAYVAPEVMDTSIPYSYMADIFSFGVVLYKYMTGRERTMYLDLLTNPKAPKEILQELSKNHSLKLAKLVTSMLSVEPDNRPSAKQILLLLQNEKENVLSTPDSTEKQNENEKHYFITCDECLTSPIVGTRYKCRTCFDYNLCKNCYQKVQHGHAFKLVFKSYYSNHKNLVVYDEVSCDGCKTLPIFGSRYQCQTCFAFDFCGNCYDALRKDHDPTHQFVDQTKKKVHMQIIELRALKKWEKIQDICEDAIQNAKNDFISKAYLAESLMNLDKPKSSDKTIQHILSQEDETELSVLVAKGLAYILKDNIDKGIEYFQKSENSSIALNQLGELYYHGKKCEKNVNKGIQYFKRASKKGNPSARYNMGLYSLQCGDEKRAFFYFKESAFNGLSLGMFQLAKCYNNGIGGPQNIDKSEYWLSKAAESGLKEAIVTQKTGKFVETEQEK